MRRFDRNDKPGRSDKRDFRPGSRYPSRSDARPERRDARPSDRGRIERRDSGSVLEFHETTCAKCGKTCEVPFRPSGNKPVYCRDCFQKSPPRRDFEPRSDRYEPRATESDASSGELDMINRKLDKIMKALKIE